MDYTNQIGEKIKSLCEFKNISVSELSERTGLAPEQIDRIINNIDIPSLAPLIKIARALAYVWELFWMIRLMKMVRSLSPSGYRRYHQFLQQCCRLTQAYGLSLFVAFQIRQTHGTFYH